MTFICTDWDFLELALDEGVECQIQGFEGDFRFLSNFYPSAIDVQRIVYASVEHAYQAAKATSRSERLQIAALETPGQAKRFGASLRVRDSWASEKMDVMKSLLLLKFRSHAELWQKLIRTGECYLEETNSWGDRYWGVCNGSGENHLGHLLMEVRTKIRVAFPVD